MEGGVPGQWCDKLASHQDKPGKPAVLGLDRAVYYCYYYYQSNDNELGDEVAM